MKKYRKKPVVIEAVQLTKDNRAEVKHWIDTEGNRPSDGSKSGLYITTLEGIMIARWGDWIIKGVMNEFYPCNPKIFEMTYEEV